MAFAKLVLAIIISVFVFVGLGIADNSELVGIGFCILLSGFIAHDEK